MNKNLERFIKYVKIDTQSDENSISSPSSKKQLDLAKILFEELKSLNINCKMEETGIVIGEIPSNTTKKVPTIGFLAHMDTALDLTGKDVKPQIIENYQGQDIILNEKYTLRMIDFPSLNNKLGHTLITTSGDTLLGADDKAGIAEIMTMLEYYSSTGEKHGDICVAFTPDEEIGRGMDCFDYKTFGSPIAYTVDGSTLGEVSYENFNAASAKIEIEGKSCHCGSA